MARRELRPQASESSLALSEAESLTSFGSSSCDAFGGSVSLNDYTTDGENTKIDDDALTELIRKLRLQTGNCAYENHAKRDDVAVTPSVAATETLDDASIQDDLIAMHLKALANSTNAKPAKSKTKTSSRSATEYLTDPAEIDPDYCDEAGTDLMSDSEVLSGDDDDEDDDDDESCASVDYDVAEQMVKQLGVKSDGGTEDNKQLLRLVVQSSSKFDYQGAPKTASTQRAWLTSLAKDLLREDSGSDEESSVAVVKYENSISNLTMAAENAKKLIDSSTKQQEKLAKWREKQRKKQPKFHALKPKQLLVARDIQTKLSQPSTNDTASDIDREVHEQGPSANDVDSVFTPVDRIFPDELTVFHNASTMFPSFFEPLKPTAEIVVPIIPKKSPSKKSGVKKDLKVIVEAAKEERSRAMRIGQDALPMNSIVQDGTTTADENKVPSTETLVRNLVDIKEPDIEKVGSNQDHSAQTTPKAAKPIVIPKGMPPYPGFGPKWPWHPYSARAPPGYRECYMHHMGDCYFVYMEYLRTRAENGNDDTETNNEKILRHSLRQEAKFKKPKPALNPYTFTSRPGKARENCVVGGISKMPKIEEGSMSSGSRVSSEANSFEKKIQKKKTQPDVFTVGKYHSKAKGRKARIVVVSGAELDRKAKQLNKQKRQQKKPDIKEKLVETISIHSIRSPAEQPHDSVDRTCMCIVM